MAGGRDDSAPGSKRKRLAADVEEDKEGADASVKRAKAGDDADTTSGQDDESQGRKTKGGGSADDDKGTSKSGMLETSQVRPIICTSSIVAVDSSCSLYT
jgi:hypothetical protein